MLEKRGFVICIVLVVVIVISLQNILALGLTPALESYNFIPGDTITIKYNVLFAPDAGVNISAEGDLAQYVSFDKTDILGGEFTATIKLPNQIEIPGRHRINIVVGQKIDPELASGFFSTRIVVMGAINLNVPFPGRYIDMLLKGHDVNVNEPIEFKLDITSKGTEDISITPKVEIYSGETKVREMFFQNRLLRSQQFLSLKKQFDTKGLNSGDYKAVAFIDYGKIASSEYAFKIGSLSISIVNYSSFIPINKLQPFNIEIESNWNNDIDGVFADVQILNNSLSIASFKTTSTSLTAWENKTIIGYIDTTNFSEGVYDANISLIYYGKEQRGTNNKMVKVQFYKAPSMLIWFIIGGIGILLILILVAIMFIKKIHDLKNGKIKKSNKK